MGKPAYVQNKIEALLKSEKRPWTIRELSEQAGASKGTVQVALVLLRERRIVENVGHGLWAVRAERKLSLPNRAIHLAGSPLLKYPMGEKPIERSLYHWK